MVEHVVPHSMLQHFEIHEKCLSAWNLFSFNFFWFGTVYVPGIWSWIELLWLVWTLFFHHALHWFLLQLFMLSLHFNDIQFKLEHFFLFYTFNYSFLFNLFVYAFMKNKIERNILNKNNSKMINIYRKAWTYSLIGCISKLNENHLKS